VQYSQDPTFASGAQTGIVNAPGTTYTVPGREADTLYYVRVKSYPNLPGDDTASDYSGIQAIRTLSQMPGTAPDGDDSVAGQLQNWLDSLESELGNMTSLVPELDLAGMNATDRRRLRGSGASRWGYIGKVSDVAVQFPQFWPNATDAADLDERIREIEVLRNLLLWFRMATRLIGDVMLIVGDDALRLCGEYYGMVRERARRKDREAVQVWQMLRAFWRHQRRVSAQTKRKALSHAKEVADGKRNGGVSFYHEEDQMIEGDSGFVDDSYPAKPRAVAKETVTEEVN
jgi:uncharacterized membrane protein